MPRIARRQDERSAGVTSQSGQRIEWSHLSKHEGNLCRMMGCAIGVATDWLGVAAPQSDCARFDAACCSRSSTRDSGKSSAEEFVIYVFDNGVYSAAGSAMQPRRRQYGFDGNGARAGIANGTRFATSKNLTSRGSCADRNELHSSSASRRKFAAPGNFPAQHRSRREQIYVRALFGANEEKTIPFVVVVEISEEDNSEKIILLALTAVVLVIGSQPLAQRRISTRTKRSPSSSVIRPAAPSILRPSDRALHRPLPAGNPTRIVENMTGAGV